MVAYSEGYHKRLDPEHQILGNQTLQGLHRQRRVLGSLQKERMTLGEESESKKEKELLLARIGRAEFFFSSLPGGLLSKWNHALTAS